MNKTSSRSPLRRHQRSRIQSLATLTVLLTTGALTACSADIDGSDVIDPPESTDVAPPAPQASTDSTNSVGGEISGLSGKGLTLAIEGHGTLAVERDGRFAFPTSLTRDDAYTLSVAQQPTLPSQTCVVTSGAKGTVSSARPSSVRIECTTNTYRVSGTVSGLAGAGRLSLTNRGGDPIEIAENGRFDFPVKLASGTSFDVTVASQPSGPSQTCRVSGGSGVVGAGDVSSVAIECDKDRFTIGGHVKGLEGKLIIRNLDWTFLYVTQTLTANGSYSLPLSVASGDPYDVEIVALPSDPHQTCTISNFEGVVSNANVGNVDIVCTTDH